MAGCSLGLAACLEDYWEGLLSAGGTSFRGGGGGGGGCEPTSITNFSFSFRGFGDRGGRLFPFLFVFDGYLLFPLTAVDVVPCFASLAFFRGGGAGDCSSRCCLSYLLEVA